MGCLTSPQPIIFQQGEVELPEGLECTDSVIRLKQDAKNYFQISVSNSSNHDVIKEKHLLWKSRIHQYDNTTTSKI